MKRHIAFPFSTLSDVSVSAPHWLISLNGNEWLPAGEFLEDWDYASSIRVRREISIDFDNASGELGLAKEEIKIEVAVQFGTGQGRLPRIILDRDCRKVTEDSPQVVFETEVTGKYLSLVLDLLTEVRLFADPETPDPLSPSHIGDRLWQDRFRIALEGEELRFPIEIADISALLGDGSLASSAPWYVHWSPRDWAHDFHGAIRVYLNAEKPEIIKKIEEEDSLTLQALLADVMGQVCERFVYEAGASGSVPAYEPGTLGGQAASWLASAWPGHDIGMIQDSLVNRPGRLRAAFLGLAQLPED